MQKGEIKMISSIWTTIFGQVLGILLGVVPMLQTGKIDWLHIGLYGASSAIGAVAKDFNITL